MLLPDATATRKFTASEVVHLDDLWQTSVYDHLCFAPARKRWVLFVEDRSDLPRFREYGSAAFARFPLRVQPVSNRSVAVNELSAQCSHAGVTYVADLKHGGGATMGIAHFAKRLLRLHGILRQPSTYGLRSIDRIAFPATSAAHLAHSWPSSMLRLVAPAAAIIPVDALLAAAPGCCFQTAVISARENTYFVRQKDANALRDAAYTAASVPQSRAACAPLRACYFQRSEGSTGGRWEGGARVIVNRQRVLALMAQLLTARAPDGRVHLVNANSSHTFSQQLAVFASCDLMVSVHGSQNANIMFMRPGTAFMELNPHKFFYSSYEELATVSRVLYLRSRDNAIASAQDVAHSPKKRREFEASKAAFIRAFGTWSDDRCQQHSRCRSQSRNFPTAVNLTDLARHFARGVEHVVHSFPRAPSCPPALPALVAAAAPLVAAEAEGPPTGRVGWRRLRAAASGLAKRTLGGRGGGGRGGGGRSSKGGIGRVVSPAAERDTSGGAEASPAVAAAAAEGGGGLRIAVCVGGQLSRLEIESKIEYVLKPTARTRPAALDLFLALELGKMLYSNIDFGAILAQQQADRCGTTTVEEVKRRFAPFLAAASFTNHTTRAIDLASWRRYRRDRPADERVTRLQHHLSQFAHMRTCAQLIERREVAARWHYDVILKMRDNTVAVAPFVLGMAHAVGHARTKRCIEWGGYNDKAMVVPRRFMDGALRGPSEDFFLVRDIGRGITNSERLLRAVLDRRGVRVQRVSASELPLVDGRCTSMGWCLVEEGKDCRPPKWTWPGRPCEEHNMTTAQKQLYEQRFKPRAAIASHLVTGVSMNDA